MANNERWLWVSVEYDRSKVTRDVDEAITRIMCDVSRRVAAKIVLLSKPELVKVKAERFNGTHHEDMLDDRFQPDTP